MRNIFCVIKVDLMRILHRSLIKISIVCNWIESNISFYLVFESHRSLFIKRAFSLYNTFFERIFEQDKWTQNEFVSKNGV